MKGKHVFFYFMRNEPKKIGMAIPEHIAYWNDAYVDYYEGGPFGDRSGGLITFGAESLEDAKKIVSDDPFVKQNLLKERWVKEWDVE